MSNEQTLQQLHSVGMNAIAVSLQLVPHKSGSDYAYTNRTPQKTATVFGNSDVNCTFSIARKGESFSSPSEVSCYIWLWDIDEVEAKMYADDFGTDAIVIVDADGNGELITYKQAKELLVPQDVSDDSPSKQA